VAKLGAYMPIWAMNSTDPDYSITSSAVASNLSGTVRPSVFAGSCRGVGWN